MTAPIIANFAGNQRTPYTMPKKFHKEAPNSYPVCLHDDCLRAATCLHQLAYQPLQERIPILHLLNPRQCVKDGQCPHYRNSAPVRYARGFTGMQKRMYPGQYDIFMATLVLQFGRNPYFERRKEERPLSPHEQKIVRRALRKAGVTEDLDFDSYEESIPWTE